MLSIEELEQRVTDLLSLAKERMHDSDYVASVIAKIDPVAVRAKGALLNLMVALKDNAAGGKLSEDHYAGEVLRNAKVRELDKDPEISRLVEKGDYTSYTGFLRATLQQSGYGRSKGTGKR